MPSKLWYLIRVGRLETSREQSIAYVNWMVMSFTHWEVIVVTVLAYNRLKISDWNETNIPQSSYPNA